MGLHMQANYDQSDLLAHSLTDDARLYDHRAISTQSSTAIQC